VSDKNRDDELLQMARRAMEQARSPYSGVKVGAVVAAGDGQVYPGCNVENASLGLTVCAERVALFNAVAHGSRNLETLVLTSNHPKVTTPCGACRQVILELAPTARIVFGDGEGVKQVWESPHDLLPDAFDGDWKA
jgi:cytidine deaminase